MIVLPSIVGINCRAYLSTRNDGGINEFNSHVDFTQRSLQTPCGRSIKNKNVKKVNGKLWGIERERKYTAAVVVKLNEAKSIEDKAV